MNDIKNFIEDNLKITKIENDIIDLLNIITIGELDRNDELKQKILDIFNLLKLLIIYVGIVGLLVSFTICNISYLSFIPFIDLINNTIIRYGIEFILIYFYTNSIIKLIGDDNDNIFPNFIGNNDIYVKLFFIYKLIPLIQLNNIINIILQVLSEIPIINFIPFRLLKKFVKFGIIILTLILSTIDLTSIKFLKQSVSQYLIDFIEPPEWVVSGLKETSDFNFLK